MEGDSVLKEDSDLRQSLVLEEDSEDDLDLEDPTLLSEEALPSQITSHAWIWVSSPHRSRMVVNLDDFETYKKETTVGKWLLFHDDQDSHDKAWMSVRSLVLSSRNTGLTGAKCSTMWSKKYTGSQSSLGGVICCYTDDYRDKAIVKKAADAIREVYNIPRDMLYKTDCATFEGKYRELGSSAISLYKHSVQNRFYERDLATKRWKLVWRV